MDSAEAIRTAFAFGPFRFIPSQRLLMKEDRQIKLGGKALDLLHLLVLRAGEEVTKASLIEHTWPDIFVEEANLKVHISSVRRALDDTHPQATYIATVAGRGYQFVASVKKQPFSSAEESAQEPTCFSNLPPVQSLVGRQRDIDCITRALDFTNLITLVGPGGVGKTSLAVAVGHAKRNEYPDGICFVDLSATKDQSLVLHVIATALGVRSDPSILITSTLERLRGSRTLVVLDNCDHVLRAVAEFAARCTQERIVARLLVTSREPLSVFGENVQRVEPLAFPHSHSTCGVDEALAFPSVALFALRAFENADYRLSESEVHAITRICELLDGLPLAIEIAAAKLDRLGPQELLEAVTWRLRELHNKSQSAHSRHQTIWAMLDWSYQQLSEQEATLFRLLSVFVGLFEWTDVAGIARILSYDPYQTTTVLGNLVSKSLISAEIEGEQLRYRILDSTRDYAFEKLARDPLFDVAQTCHAELMLALFRRSEEEWRWVAQSVWRTRYESRTGDLRKALDWCFAKGGNAGLGIDLVISAMRLWNEQSSIFEQRSQVDRALAHCDCVPHAPQKIAILATSQAWSLMLAGRLAQETEDAWDKAQSYSEQGSDRSQQLPVLFGRVNFLIWTGRFQEATSVLDRFDRVASQARDQAAWFDCERLRTQCDLHFGRLACARTRIEQLAASFAGGVPLSKITRFQLQSYQGIRGVLSYATWMSGDTEAALRIADELVFENGRTGQVMGQTLALAFGAMPLAMWTGQIERLERYSSLLRANLNRESIAVWEPVQRFYAAVIRFERGDYNAVHSMRLAIEQIVRDRLLVVAPVCLGRLAEALLSLHDLSQACDVLEWALALLNETKAHCWLPELLRVKALAVAQLGDRRHARNLLDEGRELSSAQGATFFELRIVNDLAQMEIEEGNIDEAKRMVRPLYDTFEDKTATKDLKTASRLLATDVAYMVAS